MRIREHKFMQLLCAWLSMMLFEQQRIVTQLVLQGSTGHQVAGRMDAWPSITRWAPMAKAGLVLHAFTTHEMLSFHR